MKSIYILATNKPSRLYAYNGELGLAKLIQYGSDSIVNQNIYITSDEEIKEGDWCINNINEVFIASNSKSYKHQFKKIILTTDADLIKDGVQAIDDEFIEWFIKNPSCEKIETVKEQYHQFIGMKKIPLKPNYKITITKEEAKKK